MPYVNWITKIKSWFKKDPIGYCEKLPLNYCNNKTDDELIKILERNDISRGSGEMVMVELLKRIIKRKK